MHVDIKEGPISWRGLVGATLFGLGAMHLAGVVLGLIGTTPYTLALRQRWVWMWAFPVAYGLVHATTSRPTEATLTQLDSPQHTLNTIALWAKQHGNTPHASQQPPRTSYQRTSWTHRAINRCFGIFLWVEERGNAVVVGGNRNILRHLLEELKTTPHRP